MNANFDFLTMMEVCFFSLRLGFLLLFGVLISGFCLLYAVRDLEVCFFSLRRAFCCYLGCWFLVFVWFMLYVIWRYIYSACGGLISARGRG